jgi:HSP20 family molecular chaperone IbpA
MFTNKLVKTEPVLPKPFSVLESGFGFPLFQRLSRELDDMFNTFGVERTFTQPVHTVWTPEVEMFTKNNELIVRVDVPGLKKEDLTIELTEDALILKGERKYEKEEKHEGFYRAERVYGNFSRTLPLPEGVKIDLAKAVVHDGVLEITVPIAKIEAKTKKLEITEAMPTKTVKAA